MSEPVVFAYRRAGGGCYGVAAVLGVFPVMIVASLFPEEYRPLFSALVLLVVIVAAALWVGVRSEHRLEVGPSAMRLTEQETVFGVRRPPNVLWEMPLAELDGAKEVHTRTPSSRGGWNHGYALHLPGDRVVREDMLGSRDVATSEYAKLVSWLRDRLGDRFTTEERH